MGDRGRCLLRGVVIVVVVLLALIVLIEGRVYNDSLISWREKLHSNKDVLSVFEEWMERHDKKYEDREEKLKRFQIFKSNKQYIDKKNQFDNGGPTRSYRLGLNKFADLSNDEFKANYFGTNGSIFAMRRIILRGAINNNSTTVASSNSGLRTTLDQSCNTKSLPPNKDWRSLGVVTGVKNQGNCGCCWAFSAVGAIESANAISSRKLYSLSEQELVSCDQTNHGCNGGDMDLAFKWVIKNGGLDSEHDYPYTSRGGGTKKCITSKKKINVAGITSYVDVKEYDEDALLCAVAKNPVAVAINGDSHDFQLYSTGIFIGNCPDDLDDLDHAVLIVGWGVSNQYKYWIIKNSWGTSWGMKGYMHMVRNTKNHRGICGINSCSIISHHINERKDVDE